MFQMQELSLFRFPCCSKVCFLYIKFLPKKFMGYVYTGYGNDHSFGEEIDYHIWFLTVINGFF